MGFSKKSWYGIDSYVAPLKAKAWQGRKAHVEAMILTKLTNIWVSHGLQVVLQVQLTA